MLKRNKTKYQYNIVLQFKYNDVDILLYEYNPKSGISNILDIQKIDNSGFSEDDVMEVDINKLVNSIKEKVGLVKTGNKVSKINKYIYGISDESIKNFTIEGQYKRNKVKKKIDEKEAFQIKEMVKDGSFDQIERNIKKELLTSSGDLVEIFTRCIGGDIDGKQYNTMIGNSGKNVKVLLTAYFVREKKIEWFENISKKLKFKETHVFVIDDAIIKYIGDFDKKNKNGLLVHIGNIATSVILYENGRIKAIKNLSIGKNAFVKRIQLLKKIDYISAENILEQIIESKKVDNLLLKSLSDDIDVLIEGIDLVFEYFSKKIALSSNIIVLGDIKHIKSFKTQIMKKKWRNKEMNGATIQLDYDHRCKKINGETNISLRSLVYLANIYDNLL